MSSKRSFSFLLLTGILCLAICARLSAEEKKSTASGIKEFRGVVYKKIDNQELKLNIFLPEKDGKIADKLPTLIYIDSGCWNSGSPGNGGLWRKFGALEKGFACVSISHRALKNGTIFPKQIEDVKAAIRFLRAHAKEYHLDSDRFATLGISSGGHLSLMLGIPDKNRQFDVGDNLDQSSKVQRVICFYSLVDFAARIKETIKINKSCVMEVCGCLKDEKKGEWVLTPEILERARLCSPINYVNGDYSPTLLLHGVKDSIPISHSCMMYEKLKNYGVRTQLFVANDGIHQYQTIAPDKVLEKMFFDFLQW